MAKKTTKAKETKQDETPKTEVAKFKRDDKGLEWTRYYSHHYVAATEDGTIVAHADSEDELGNLKAQVYTVEQYIELAEQ